MTTARVAIGPDNDPVALGVGVSLRVIHPRPGVDLPAAERACAAF